jgi:hypothetical protein
MVHYYWLRTTWGRKVGLRGGGVAVVLGMIQKKRRRRWVIDDEVYSGWSAVWIQTSLLIVPLALKFKFL